MIPRRSQSALVQSHASILCLATTNGVKGEHVFLSCNQAANSPFGVSTQNSSTFSTSEGETQKISVFFLPFLFFPLVHPHSFSFRGFEARS